MSMLASLVHAQCPISRNSYISLSRSHQIHHLKYNIRLSPWTREVSSHITPKRARKKGDAIAQDGKRIVLTLEQQFILDKVLDGTNLFYTGSAGTGKSVLLREIIQRLRMNGLQVAVTASTGIAAVNIGGTTLHAFAGIGLGKLPLQELLARARQRTTRRRWLETQALVIDEISMVSAQLLDLVERVAREARQNTKPFGGIQVVVSGDFFQLPPVPDREDFGSMEDCKFAFEANCWDKLFPEAYKLTSVFRQKDAKLIRLLNEMRVGIITDKSKALLTNLSRPLTCDDGIQPTELFPYRTQVELANTGRMARLASEGRHYVADDVAGKDLTGNRVSMLEAQKMLELRVPKSLTLRLGAQVMCIQNLPDSSLVNGSIGRVINFITPEEALKEGFPIAGASVKLSDEGVAQRPGVKKVYQGLAWPLVRFTNGGEFLMIPSDFQLENAAGEMRARRRQVPLILAWALTIHKAQGQTIDRLKVDLRRTFAPGQAYVAISRCRTLEQLQLTNFSPSAVFVDPKVIEWDRNLSVAPMEQQKGKVIV